ncbi:cobalt-zinc-cadmium efflux system outer membrane protein [Chitinophaga polysaccharea]|uniref:Cobalt-zinc-cadmium efflux system outer membrane protein n=1 Tax=Chitinophaga polysaccharea TaxID=1293035 RepID=A0A561PWH3_9BACT|nr:TolC family protein [Chitinophaga polysaccharea]TWF42474.1 cobalt-zinc-cadmium efflux system outer membrane protein [Chitinophaga polysaccharea]
MRTIRMLLLAACGTCLGFIQPTQAQNSVQTVTLQSVEDSFLVKNYLLLAQRYQIDASKALVRQAKMWSNPSFSTVLGFGSTDKLKPFNVGSGGETQYNIDQLIQTAGKRNKAIQLAATATKMSEANFDELIRTLRLQLRENVYNIYYQQQTEKVLKEQLGNLQTIVDAYVTADKKGSVAHADLVRLQALQVGIENDFADLKQQELESQKNLQQLLHSQDFYAADIKPADLAPYTLDKIQLPQLLEAASKNRADVRMADLQYQTAQLNYRLQKSLAVPDLHVGATYDKQGSYVNNFVGLTLGIDLPVWNRNQGNIHAAKLQINSEQQQLLQQQSVAQTEVLNAYQRIVVLEKRYKGFDLHQFQGEFDTLIAEVSKNFSKGNISLLQFIDYFNSYSDNAKNINKFLSNRVNAYEELNYATGQELFKN